jgi:putative ABC transport system substrate-binding protein
MRRRDLMALLAGAAALPVVWPQAARAQQTGNRIARIGFLSPSGAASFDPVSLAQFKAGLVENGLIEGRNITLEVHWADGNLDRLRELAFELGGRDFDVIVTAGPQAARLLKETQTKTPIVLAIVGDMLADGIVDSLAHPNGNITGLSMSNKDLEAKRIEILKEAVPAAKRLMILWDPSMGPMGVAEAQAAANSLGIESLLFEASDPSQFGGIFEKAAKAGVDSLSVMASPFLNRNRKSLVPFATAHRLPSIWEASVFVKEGGLISYGPNFPDMYRRSAGYVAKIIAGAKPGDLPVQLPVKFELVINSATAKALGLTIPATLLARADDVID